MPLSPEAASETETTSPATSQQWAIERWPESGEASEENTRGAHEDGNYGNYRSKDGLSSISLLECVL